MDFPNKIVISPMSQYSAVEGHVQDWHRHHIAGLALGRSGSLMVEVAAVMENGRGTAGDLGIWADDQVPGLAELARIIESQGIVPAIQIGHAGRKASMQRPWEGNQPLALDSARASYAWQTVAASPQAVQDGWPVPLALDDAGMAEVLDSFLSPITNQRNDIYGGTLENRMRFPLAVVAAVRDELPPHLPLSVRISAVDGVEGGWQLADSVEFARRMKAFGVDIVDCSSGGIQAPATAGQGAYSVKRGPGFQVPFAQAIRQNAQVPTIAVGLIVDPSQAEKIFADQDADFIAIGREALFNPNWPLHARMTLGEESDYASWPEQYGWWLNRRPKNSLAGEKMVQHA